jgi:hypothetical protein
MTEVVIDEGKLGNVEGKVAIVTGRNQALHPFSNDPQSYSTHKHAEVFAQVARVASVLL